MKKRFIFSLALLISAFSFSGCELVSAGTDNAPAASVIDGVYSDGAVYDKGDDGIQDTADDNGWGKETMTISNGVFTSESVEYIKNADGTCGAEAEKWVFSGSIAVGAQNADGTYNIDISFTSCKVTIYDATLIAQYNAVSTSTYFYGYGTGSPDGEWVAGEERDVTGKSWDDGTDVDTIETFSIYSIAQVVNDVLFLGNSDANGDGIEETGDSASNRDAVLETTGVARI